MVVLEEKLSEYLVQNAPGRTDRVLMDRFGISYNTFRKIEARAPIRPSLAQRLSRRLYAELAG